METLHRELMNQSTRGEHVREEYQLPSDAEKGGLKKELPERRYFTLLKLRTYDCELKVE